MGGGDTTWRARSTIVSGVVGARWGRVGVGRLHKQQTGRGENKMGEIIQLGALARRLYPGVVGWGVWG